MSPPNHDQYLHSEIFAASPEKRQLMLIEEMIRCVRKADQLLAEQQPPAAIEEIDRARTIALHILAALNPEPARDLVGKVAAVYLFILKSLNAAVLEQSRERLDEALRVLREEQTTWKALCERNAAHAAVPGPKGLRESRTPQRFSLEA